MKQSRKDTDEQECENELFHLKIMSTKRLEGDSKQEKRSKKRGLVRPLSRSIEFELVGNDRKGKGVSINASGRCWESGQVN